MQHPDEHVSEGTIHAWLDGQLPADEAARLEEHVASCKECAAAVAEARGLIAASSRIVTALDHTPGNVIPIATRKPRRFRMLTPMISAIAATIVIAAGALYVQYNPVSGSKPVGSVLRDTDFLPKQGPVAAPIAAPVAAAPIAAAPQDRPTKSANASTHNAADVGPAPQPRITALKKVDVPPPAAAPLATKAAVSELAERRAAEAKTADVHADSVDRVRTRRMVAGAAASGAGVGGRSALAPASASMPMQTRMSVAADRNAPVVGCYEADESTDVLPRRFALTPDGRLQYVDSTGKRDGLIPDLNWTDSSGAALIRTQAGAELLRIRRANNELLADAAGRDRPVKALSCHY